MKQCIMTEIRLLSNLEKISSHKWTFHSFLRCLQFCMLSKGNRQVQVNSYTHRLFFSIQVIQGGDYREL